MHNAWRCFKKPAVQAMKCRTEVPAAGCCMVDTATLLMEGPLRQYESHYLTSLYVRWLVVIIEACPRVCGVASSTAESKVSWHKESLLLSSLKTSPVHPPMTPVETKVVWPTCERLSW